jgi:hypothetical protein
MTDAVEKTIWKYLKASLIQKVIWPDSFVSNSNSTFLCGDLFDSIDPKRSYTLVNRALESNRQFESPRRIRYDAVTPSQGDAALRMLALGCLEDGAGELCVRSASQDALDSIAATIVPQLHSVGELLLWQKVGPNGHSDPGELLLGTN